MYLFIRRIVWLALLSASSRHPGDVLFPQCLDCSVRVPACKSRQLGVAGCMGLKVVKANWPSVWGWCRRITEMIRDNIQIDVLPQGWLEGFLFCTFFSRPGLKIHGCTWLFVPLLCFSHILAQPKPSSARNLFAKGLYTELRRKAVQFSGKSPKYRCLELKKWCVVVQVKISKS